MTFVVDKPLGLDFEGAFVSGQPDLCWVADNTKKLASSTFVGGLEVRVFKVCLCLSEYGGARGRSRIS